MYNIIKYYLIFCANTKYYDKIHSISILCNGEENIRV